MSEVFFLYPLSGGDALASGEDRDGCPDPSAERTVFSKSGHGDAAGWLSENKRLLCLAGRSHCGTSGAVSESSYVHAIQTAGEDPF